MNKNILCDYCDEEIPEKDFKHSVVLDGEEIIICTSCLHKSHTCPHCGEMFFYQE